MVLAGGHRQYVDAVGHHDEARLLAVEVFLDHDTAAGLAEGIAGEHVAHRILGGRQVHRDDHALAGGQSIGLDDDGYAPVVDVGECRFDLGEGPVIGGRDLMAGEKILGERLRTLELSRTLARPEAFQTGLIKGVDDADHQRRLWADDSQVDGLFAGKRDQCDHVLGAEGREVPQAPGGDPVAGHQARVTRLPVDGVQQHVQVRQVPLEDAPIVLRPLVVVLQDELGIGRPRLHHVLFFEDHLGQLAGVDVPQRVRQRGRLDVAVGQQVEDLLGALGDVAVAGEADHHRPELERQAVCGDGLARFAHGLGYPLVIRGHDPPLQPGCAAGRLDNPENQRLAAERSGLHIHVPGPVVARLDDELPAFVIVRIKPDHRAIEQGRTGFVDGVDAAAAVGLEQAQGAHHEPGAALSLVLVAEISVGEPVSIITMHDGAAPFLRKPGLPHPVKEKGEMHGLLIALHHRVVPILIVQAVKAGLITFSKSPVESFNETVFTDGLSQCGNILRHKERQLPGVSLYIMLIGPRFIGVKIGQPLPFGILHPCKSCFFVDDVLPVITSFEKGLIIAFFSKRLGHL